MGIIQTDNLKPGMTVAADVLDRNGRLLLGAGSELTDRHIYVFRMWGVVETDIVGLDEDNDSGMFTETDNPEILAAAEEEVKYLFRHADIEHPVINQLVKLSVQRRVRHASR